MTLCFLFPPMPRGHLLEEGMKVWSYRLVHKTPRQESHLFVLLSALILDFPFRKEQLRWDKIQYPSVSLAVSLSESFLSSHQEVLPWHPLMGKGHRAPLLLATPIDFPQSHELQLNPRDSGALLLIGPTPPPLAFTLCVWVLCLHMCLYSMHVQDTQKPEEGVRSPGTGVIDSCEPPCVCWESNLGPVEKQPVLFFMGLSLLSPPL